MTKVRAVLGGLLVAAVAIAALELPLRRQQAELDQHLLQQDRKLDPLLPIRFQVEDYQRRKARLQQQVEWVEVEREKTCALPLGSIDPDGVAGVRIDELALDHSSLVALGVADSEAALERLTASIRTLPWARDVRAGAAGAERSTFGLFAGVEVCKSGGPARAAPRRAP